MGGMASVETEVRAEGDDRTFPSAAGERAPLGPVVALSIAIVIGLALATGPVVRALLPVTELVPPWEDHHQNAETLMFVLSLFVLLPAAVVSSSWIGDRIASGSSSMGLSAAAAMLVSGLGIAVIFTKAWDRVSSAGGGGVLVAVSALWCALAALLLWRAASTRPWDLLDLASRYTPYLWAAAAFVVLGAAFSLSPLDSLSPVVLVVGAALTAAVLITGRRVRISAPPPLLGRAADLAVVVLLLLAIPNLVVFVTGDPSTTLQTAIVQWHQNFYLGPANQILAGDVMLVDSLSQYGVGSIYFLAAAFQAIPIGNGTLGLIEGLLSALMFIGVYATLRIAGVARLLAGSAMAVAVVALVFALKFPLGALLQHGAFRFGLPVGVILGATMESRWPRAARPARALQLVTVAIASVWALEAFIYTLLTVLAIIALRVTALPSAQRRRELVRSGLAIAGACLIAHLTLVTGTLLATGQLPDWGWYLTTLREFLFGQVGDLTYDFSSWSAGLALGAVYLASASAAVLTVRRRPDLVATERPLMTAIVGMTAFGVALFSYLVNRSADHIVPYVALPAIALGALWLALVLRPSLSVPYAARRGAIGFTLAVATLIVAAASPAVSTRFPESALGHMLPGGASLTDALDRLWEPAPFTIVTSDGERLVETFMPNERRSIVLTRPDAGLEVLIRTGRASAVPLGDPWEDSYVPDGHLPALRDFVEGLAPGDRMLIDAPARAVFTRYLRQPSRDPLADVLYGVTGAASGVPGPATGLTTLQEWVLKEIGKRYALRSISRSVTSGLEVVELVPRRSPI